MKAPVQAQNPNHPTQTAHPQAQQATQAGTANPQPAHSQDAPNPTKAATTAEAKTDGAKTTKSIVPSKYAGRYKNGGEDPLAIFIKDQCAGKDGFDFDKFFDLCAKNGIDQAKVDHYKGQVSEKRHGAQGRARMTLRNMLATIVRKNGKAVGLDDKEVDINLPKPQLTGAAKAAQEKTTTASAAA